MYRVTKTKPELRWSPAHTLPEERNFLVRCIISSVEQKPKWEKGTLSFVPKQEYIPIVISDSLAKPLERHPNAIYIVHCDATAAMVRAWAEKYLPGYQRKAPLPLWLIVQGGGNDLTAGNLKGGVSADSLAGRVISTWRKLESWCEREGVKLTITNTIPRPYEQDSYKSPNPMHVQEIISRALCTVNAWAERRNVENGVAPLVLSKYVEYGDRVRHQMGGKKVVSRCYRGRQQRRITLSSFTGDMIQLSSKGARVVGNALSKYISEVI